MSVFFSVKFSPFKKTKEIFNLANRVKRKKFSIFRSFFFFFINILTAFWRRISSVLGTCLLAIVAMEFLASGSYDKKYG